MAYASNAWLEKYEIKKPDYDLIERDYVGMRTAMYKPLRYTHNGQLWIPKKIGKRLFGKKQVRLMFVGDITCFEKQFEEARKGKDYDFSYEFDLVRPIFGQADLVVGNLETMIFPDAPYRTEKYVSEQNFHCNAPLEFLDAVRRGGVDVLTNANNHDLDTGAIGIGETIDNVESFGFIQTGTFKTDKKRYELIDVSGFKIAITAFATNHNNKECNLTPEGVEFLLNNYSRDNAEEIILDARSNGAELVFTCIHWGRENKTVHNKEQTAIAKELATLGYDCVIGSHPHVLQPFSVLYTEDKSVPVFYSLGNFVSHNVNNQKARSIIACIDLFRNGQDIDLKCSYIPVYTSKSYGNKKYVVVPIGENPKDPGNVHKKEQIENVIGYEIEPNQDIVFKEYVEKVDDSSVGKSTAKFDLSKIRNFPTVHDDGKFRYRIYRDRVCLEGISEQGATSSYSVPSQFAGLPVTRLADGAFEHNQIMKKINFCKTLPYISVRACKNCVHLEGFQLGSRVMEIKEEAFMGCVNLAAAVMRNKVTCIGSKAFMNCSELRTVKIPASVTEISDDAFSGCPKAVFYCEKGSYAECYAKKHGFKVVNMQLT